MVTSKIYMTNFRGKAGVGGIDLGFVGSKVNSVVKVLFNKITHSGIWPWRRSVKVRGLGTSVPSHS